MAEGLVRSMGVWASFRSLQEGGDLDDTVKTRRQVFAQSNADEEVDELPEVNIDTAALFDPAARLQPVPREGETRQATIGPVAEGQITAPPPAEPERPQVSITEFKARMSPTLAAAPVMAAIEALSPDAQSQIVGGVMDFVSNTVDGIGALMGEGAEGRIRQLSEQVPQLEKSDRFSSQMARGVAQYGTAFLPMLGVAQKVLSGARISTKALVADQAASAVSDFFAFEGKDKRLADVLLDEMPELKSWPHVGSLMEYLEGDPGDTELEGRWKTVVEGQILNGLIGAVVQPKAVVRDFRMITKEVQKVNFLNKYLGNQVGAVGDPGSVRRVALGDSSVGVSQKDAEALKAAQAAPDPGTRLKESTDAVKRAGTATEANVAKMADEFAVPVRELDNLNPGQVRTIEEQAGLVNTARDLNQQILDASLKVSRNPADTAAIAELDQHTDDLIKTYTAYVGSESEAGRLLKGGQTLDGVLQSTGVTRTIDTLQTYKRGTVDDKVMFAQRLQGIPKKDQNRYLKDTGAQLATGKPLRSAMAEAFTGTRFTPLSLSRNVISNSIFMTGLVGERYLAAGVSKLPGLADSPVTFTEATYMATGMVNSVFTGFRAYLDQSFRPGQAASLLNPNSKVDAFQPAITREALGVQNTLAGGFVDAIGHLARFFPNQMSAMDDGFKTILRQGEMQALSYREAVRAADELIGGGVTDRGYQDIVQEQYRRIIQDPPQSIVDAADEFSHYGTFTDNFTDKTSGGKVASSLQKHFNAHPEIKLLVPFFRTPVRIAQAAVKRVPLLGAAITDSQELLSKSDAERKAFSLAKQAMGALVGIGGATLVANQWLIGQGPTSPKGKELMRLQGHEPFSLVTQKDSEGRPSKAVALKDLPGPYGIALRMMADSVETIHTMSDLAMNGDLTPEQEEAHGDYMAGLMATMAKTFEDQVFFRNLVNLITQTRSGNTNAVERFIASPIPPMVTEVATFFDPAVKEVDTLKDALMEKIPFLRDQLPPKVTLLGQEYIRGMGVFPEMAKPGLAEYLATRAAPLMATGNFDPRWQPIIDFQGDHLDRLSGIGEVSALGGVKLSPEQQAAFMRVRAGVPHELPNGDVLQPFKVDGLTLRERLLLVATGQEADNVKIALYNGLVAGYSKGARVEIEAAFPDLAERIQERKLTGLGIATQAVIE